MNEGCPSCGERDLPGRSRFCLTCGAELRPAAPASYTPEHLERDVLGSPFAREGERKEVTVLFADVAGSLAMSAALDPEDVHQVMNALFALAIDAVHAEQGTINQFRGDGFMALFGAPRAHGEDASRAVRAALRIRDESVRYGRSVQARFGIPLALRQGLHTGTVWVGSIGKDRRLDYTAEGITVGTAARIEQAATPGQILVSDETARRVGAFFELTQMGARELRGLEQPVQLFEVTGPGRHERRLDAELATGLAPFVGRRSELEWLSRKLDGVARTGELEAVVVHGEAGIGKSRLVLEHLSRESSRIVSLEARCRPAQRNRALGAWLEIARSWPAGLSGAERARSLESLLSGDGPGSAASSSSDLASDLAALLGEAGRREPLVLVFEDAQWMDPSSAALLTRLIREPTECPVLVVVTARGQPREAEGPWSWGEQLALGPLADADSSTLARSLVADAHDGDTLVAVSVRRGGGNPLFVEELARSLVDGSPEMREAARLEEALARHTARVPETLQDVIASRIDALPDGLKRLAQTASVIGRPFGEELLMELDPQSAPTLRGDTRALLERGIWAREADRLHYRHGLVREVAYAQLLRGQRRELHRRCAEALARSPGATTTEVVSEIGHHFDAAGDAARAAAALGSAGKAYLARSAVPEAAVHLRRARELLDTDPDAAPEVVGSIGLALATALNRLDQTREALEVLGSIESLPLGTGERTKAAQSLIEHGWVTFSQQNDVAGSRELIARGLQMLRGVPEAWRVEASAHTYLSRIEGQDGEIARAATSANRLIELALAHGDEAGHAYGLATRGCALCDSGEIETAIASCRESREICDRIGSEVLAGFACCWLAKGLVFAGRPEAALQAASEGEQLGERTSQVGIVYSSRAWSAFAWLLLDEPGRALELFEGLASLGQRFPSDLEARARTLVELGRTAEATPVVRECLDQDPPRLIRVRALCTLGRALGLAAREPVAEAESALQQAVSLAGRLGLRPHQADAHLALAEVYACWSAIESSRTHARTARDLYAKCGMEAHARRASGLL